MVKRSQNFPIGYKGKEETEHVMMISINGAYIQEDYEMKIDIKHTIYPFTLYTRWDKKTLYCIRAEERKLWVDTLRTALNQSDIYKSYEIGASHWVATFCRSSSGADALERCASLSTS